MNETAVLIGELDFISLASLAAVAFIGLPHGALDGAVSMRLGFASSLLKLTGFIAGYLAIGSMVVGCWMLAPTASLLGFLFVSLIHFGLGDSSASLARNDRLVQAGCHGGLVVLGISLMHRPQVEVIFAVLGADPQLLWPVLEAAIWPLLMLLAVYGIRAISVPAMRYRFMEIFLLAAVFWYTPPLLGFAIYFCCVHSRRHIAALWAMIRHNSARGKMLQLSLLFTLASWLAGGVMIYLLAASGPPGDAILQVVFIGLAALTVPHMLLIDLVLRRHSRYGEDNGHNSLGGERAL